jgi:hypothetical protein
LANCRRAIEGIDYRDARKRAPGISRHNFFVSERRPRNGNTYDDNAYNEEQPGTQIGFAGVLAAG